MQLFTVIAHLSNIVMPGLRPNAYRWSIVVTSLTMLWMLALQTYSYRKRTLKHGAEPSWSKFSRL